MDLSRIRTRTATGLVLAASSFMIALPVTALGNRAHHSRHHHPSHPAHHMSSGIPQHNGGDHDSDNNGGPSDGDGNF
jgi:hypothetical protein